MSAKDELAKLVARLRIVRWEIAAALGGAVLSFAVLPFPAAPFAALLAVLAVGIAAVDLDRRIIPDVANAALFALGLLLVLAEAGLARTEALGEALLRSIVAGGLLFLLRFAYARATGIEGLGLGDVKLAAAAAPFLAWTTLAYTLVIAATAAAMVVGAIAIRRRERLDGRFELPFGAFLAPAIWLSFVLERLGFLVA